MWGNGKRIRCTARGSLHGRMAASTRASTKMIRSTVMADSHGLMDASTMDSGVRDVRMESVTTHTLMEETVRGSGSMGNAQSGSQRSRWITPGRPLLRREISMKRLQQLTDYELKFDGYCIF